MQTGPRGFVPSPLQTKGLSAMWTNWIVAAASLSPAEQNEITRATSNGEFKSRLSSRGFAEEALPSGKPTKRKSPFYSWVNPLFLWPFSIAILTYVDITKG